MKLLVVDTKTSEERIVDPNCSFDLVKDAELIRRDRVRNGKYVRQYIKHVLKDDGTKHDDLTNDLDVYCKPRVVI